MEKGHSLFEDRHLEWGFFNGTHNSQLDSTKEKYNQTEENRKETIMLPGRNKCPRGLE